MRKWIRRKCIGWMTHHLFNSITEEDILRIKGGKMYYKGKPMSKEGIDKLKLDALSFENSVIWQILSDEMKYQANQKIFYKAQNSDDLIAAKTLLYLIETMENKLKSIVNL